MTLPVTTHSVPDWIRRAAKVINDIKRDLEVSSDQLTRGENEILLSFGDKVSVKAKGKTLAKFGRKLNVGTTYETVAEFQGAIANESYVATNLIDSISSSNGGDTQVITVEGHTIDGSGNLEFVAQDATLNGQTEVTLAIPLARANRAYIKDSGIFNSPQPALSGTVSVYDNTDGVSSGVPSTDAAAKLVIKAGESQSNKAATSISSGDYWLIQGFDGGVGESGGSANRVTVRMESRDVANGGVWRPMRGEMVLEVGQPQPPILFSSPVIVPKNHDFRVRAKTNSNTAEIFATVSGVLAEIA